MFADLPCLWSWVLHIAWLFRVLTATASRTRNPCANKGFGLSCIKHDEKHTASSVAADRRATSPTARPQSEFG
jgi:hypothetical protein